jgi:hypothetical protein
MVESKLMSYKALIGKQLTLAFNMSKDLAIDVIFSKPNTQEFDFSSGVVTTGTISNITLKAIPSKIVKTQSSETMQLLVKNQDAGPLNIYTEVSINLVVWKVVSAINSNNYTTLLQLSRTL